MCIPKPCLTASFMMQCLNSNQNMNRTTFSVTATLYKYEINARLWIYSK